MRNHVKKHAALLLALCLALSMLIPCFVLAESAGSEVTVREIVEELAVYYGTYGAEAE